MKTLRVLIVEDYRDTANLVAIWVASAAHKARICETAFAATGAMPDFRPDIVLLDIGLPDMDGWELAPLLRQDNPELTIIAITAYQSLDDRQRSKDAGIDLHLGKPLQRDRILALLALATAGQPIA